MSKIAIKVEKLSKRYRIGLREEMHDTLLGAMTSWIKSPLNNFRRLRKLSTFEENGNGEDIIWALKDVSFEVKQGEVIGIIGRNGAGKSTLLKILSHITEPTSGRAIINGRLASLLEVGTGFHPELTGRENVYLNGTILGMTKQEVDSKFDEIVAFAEVEKFLDTPVKRYSSGMYMRLAFSVAAHLEPDILVVDEVLAVGDTQFQKKCLEKMETVGKEGRTILFVSHNMGAIAALCDKCIHLKQGRLKAFGKSYDIIQEYLAQNQTEGSINLANWIGERKGDGPMCVQQVSTLDHKERISSTFSYNEPIIINIDINAPKESQCVLGVSIRDYMGNVIIHLSNLDDKSEIKIKPGLSTIQVTLNQSLLNDGLYHLTIWLGDGFNILHDRVLNCLCFKIDSTMHGQIISQGKIRLPAQWVVVN